MMRALKSRISFRALLTALLAIVCAGGARAQALGGSQPQGIRLQVTETAGIQRSQAPVLAGVPLPQNSGVVDITAFDLRDSNGEPIPFNARVLARWNRPTDDPSAPIKWLALTFATDLQARSKATFELVQSPTAAPTAKIAWRGPDGIHVDTGALGFRVANEGGGLFENLRIDMNGDRRLDVRLIGDSGAELQWPGPTGLEAIPLRARLLSSGPAEAIVRLEAQPTGNSAARLLVWLHAYRNRPWLRTVVRACGVPTNDVVRLRIPVETLGDPLRVALGLSVGDAESDWFPGESFPLDARSVARMVRQDADAVWSAQLDGQSFWTDESVAWAEVSALGWGVTVGALPGSDSSVREISLAGAGDITVDITPVGNGCATVELFLQFRGGRAGDVREFRAFSSPLVATAETTWYHDSLGLGPAGLGVVEAAAADAAMRADGDWDPAFGLLASWLGSQGNEAAWLQAAAQRVAAGADEGFGLRLRGPLLYFWLTGDPRVEEALAAAAGALLRNNDRDANPWLPVAHLDMWEFTGSPVHLQAAQARLRTVAIGLHAAACGPDAAKAGLVLEALGRYAWARRLTQRADRQAEQALQQLLDQMLSCPAASLLADGFAYGALLTDDTGRRSAYMHAAESSLRAFALPGIEREDAGLRLRTGRTYAWLQARLGEDAPRRGQ